MEVFNKPPLTYEKQVELLLSRGLIVTDRKRAERHLANISYYRLSAYMLPYKKKEDGIIIDAFKEGTTWDDIYDLYVFDRKLRLLVFDAIERLEVAIRTQIIYQLSHKYGSHWQDNAHIFNPPREVTLRDGGQSPLTYIGKSKAISRNSCTATGQRCLSSITTTNTARRRIRLHG